VTKSSQSSELDKIRILSSLDLRSADREGMPDWPSFPKLQEEDNSENVLHGPLAGSHDSRLWQRHKGGSITAQRHGTDHFDSADAGQRPLK
jgi:hypothetical protein